MEERWFALEVERLPRRHGPVCISLLWYTDETLPNTVSNGREPVSRTLLPGSECRDHLLTCRCTAMKIMSVMIKKKNKSVKMQNLISIMSTGAHSISYRKMAIRFFWCRMIVKFLVCTVCNKYLHDTFVLIELPFTSKIYIFLSIIWWAASVYSLLFSTHF